MLWLHKLHTLNTHHFILYISHIFLNLCDLFEILLSIVFNISERVLYPVLAHLALNTQLRYLDFECVHQYLDLGLLLLYVFSDCFRDFEAFIHELLPGIQHVIGYLEELLTVVALVGALSQDGLTVTEVVLV